MGGVSASNSSEANEAVAASRDGSLTSNLLTPAATPLTAMRTPLARVGVKWRSEA